MGDEVDQNLKLYIRLPFKIEDELQVRSLHPDILKVFLPRQKRKWCIVSFASKEACESAFLQLKGKKINGKSLFCRPVRKGEKLKKTKVVSEKPESLLDLIK